MLIVELSLLSPLKHLALAAFSVTAIDIASILGMMRGRLQSYFLGPPIAIATSCNYPMVLVGVVGVVNGGAARRCGRRCGHGHGVLVNVGGGVVVVGSDRCKY